MVQIIENPAYSGGPVDPTGQNLASSLNSIAGAFLNTGRGDLVRAKFAAEQQQEMQKQAAIGTIADVFGRYLGQNTDYAQDYAQDAPDYSAPQPYQPPPFQFDPSQFSQAALQSGVDLGQIGKTLQLGSALQGGPNAPGVLTGAIPADTVKGTPQYIDQAVAQEANKPLTVAQGTDVIRPSGEVVYSNPKEDMGKYGVIDEDSFGNKVYGYPPPRGAAPIKKETALPVDTGLHGQAFLDQLEPGIRARVQQIVEGRGKFPMGYFQKTPDGRMLATYANAVDPEFDESVYYSRQKVRNDFAAGGPNSVAGTITAGNTALLHLGEAFDKVDKLGNTQSLGGLPGVPTLNAAKNFMAQSTGAPSGDVVVKLKADAERFNEEATKFYRGLGGSESDIQRGLIQFDVNLPPSQLKGYIQEQAQLLKDKVSQVQERWRTGMGPLVPDFPVINADGKRGLDKIFGKQVQDAGVQSAAPQGATESQGVVQNTPQAGDPLSAARAAIAKGAPREAVIQRLQQHGIDPAGL